VRRCAFAQWGAWGKDLVIPDAPEEVRREAFLSAMILKVHQGRTYPGAVIASLSVPWGNTSDNHGGYHLVWMRDAVEAGLALLSVGQVDDARRMLAYAMATQRADGGWPQNGLPDGRAFWAGVQLDEVGFPILLAAKLDENGALDGLNGVAAMILAAAGYLARNGPISPQDRWVKRMPGDAPLLSDADLQSIYGTCIRPDVLELVRDDVAEVGQTECRADVVIRPDHDVVGPRPGVRPSQGGLHPGPELGVPHRSIIMRGAR